MLNSTSEWSIRLFVLFKSSLQPPFFISSKFDQFLCKPQLFCKNFKLWYLKNFVKYLDEWSHFKGTMNLFLIILILLKKKINYNILKHFKLEMCMLNKNDFFRFEEPKWSMVGEERFFKMKIWSLIWEALFAIFSYDCSLVEALVGPFCSYAQPTARSILERWRPIYLQVGLGLISEIKKHFGWQLPIWIHRTAYSLQLHETPDHCLQWRIQDI